ncbi:putative Translation initiation factor 1A IF 1 [Trypanosoma vivax]|uniref:Putative eukaryotic translation initiation factor 1A n=1 Tax=Trypanosoma vivax (strain Y486) TaxID=1055687 RepID=G0U1H6_TRYVY|nr:putative eukaryotic translation initiation factor 1A [Trypanosoma vivax]KAH8609177.1 putative Translation initiation factor 1A IF 1 [Trypanosoma vivax]CCC49933.1 putative eukaryotic translation initiation factor 1A [Trypanosoma vivax Y486]
MPKNMGKGGKSFKAGNTKGIMQNQKRELVLAMAEEGEEYAQVKKPLGNLRVDLQLADGGQAIGVIRGAMVRKVWIGQGDVVIISRREFNQNDMVDVIYRYNPQEVRTLVKREIIPRDFRSAEELQENNARLDYVFVAENDNDDSDDNEENANYFNREMVVLDDPLADFDDL